MDIITILIGIAAFTLTFIYMKTRPPHNAPPGPYAWPFVGNVLALSKTDPFHFKAHGYYKKYGPVSSLQMAGLPTVLLSGYEALKEALVEKVDMFSHRRLVPVCKLNADVQHGVVFANGETWELHRKLVMKSFRDLGFGSKALETKVLEEVQAVVKDLEENQGRRYDFHNTFNLATADVICAVLFNKRFEYDEPEYVDMVKSLNFVMKTGGFTDWAYFMPLPVLVILPFLRPSVFKTMHVYAKLNAFLSRQVQQHKSTFDPSHVRDLVDVFLDAGVKDEYITHVLSDLFFGGTETTSTTLLWIFAFMIRHTDVQDKCRQEIHQLVGNSRFPQMDDRDDLPFTHATIMEVQRLASILAISPLPYGNKTATQLHGYNIADGTVILANYYSVHMDETKWDNPGEFRPERFLSNDKKSVIKPEYFLPFGMGRRSCLGENLARMELFLFFAGLLQKFRFTAADPDKVPTLQDCTYGASVIPQPYDVIIDAV